MSRLNLTLLVPGILLGVGMLVASCTKDDIPTTPSSPFLFTSVDVGKTTTPVPTTVMRPGQTYTVRFQVNYTLAPQDEVTRSRLAVFADIFSRDVNNAVTVLRATPTTRPALAAAGGVVADSLSITVPLNARVVRLEAYLDTIPAAGFVLRIDTTQSWPVQ